MPTDAEIKAAAKVLAASYAIATDTLGPIQWAALARRVLEAAEAARAPTVIVEEQLTREAMPGFVDRMRDELLAAAAEYEPRAALKKAAGQ